MFQARIGNLGRTWVAIDGVSCGAKADKRGPIGGGSGYKHTVRPGKRRVATLDELIAALGKANPGDTVFIDGQAEIDCTERVFTEKLVLEIPGGVTLAIDRGRAGALGAVIRSDAFATKPLIQIMGPGARIAGLRVRGPDPRQRLEHHDRSFAEGRGHEYYYKFPDSIGVLAAHDDLEVDGCELAGWSRAAISLKRNKGHRVHHNFIHHNQYNGLGYGVCIDCAFCLVEYNLFNYNRHSIAGTGRPGSGYEARHNIELGKSLSHCFDMHGGRDRQDDTDVAGDWVKVHHNTFRARRTAVVIRGLPQEEVGVYHNWFCDARRGYAVRSPGRTKIYANAYGLVRPRLLDP